MSRLFLLFALVCIASAWSQPVGRVYTEDQVARHNKASDCWSILNGRIYNYTILIAEGTHSGGVDRLITGCGRDMTVVIEATHEGGAAQTMASLDKRPELFMGTVIKARTYTSAQVTLHNKPTDCWNVISGRIYNYTQLIVDPTYTHGGGAARIIANCGTDRTAALDASHEGGAAATADSLDKRLGMFIGLVVETKTYTRAQVVLHNKATDCWNIVSGRIYNYTILIAEGNQHGGGVSRIIANCGTDRTAAIAAAHEGGLESTIASLEQRSEMFIGLATETKTYTRAQIATHNKATDCWNIVSGRIYNYTMLVVEGNTHGGGVARIIANCGTDRTSAIEAAHEGGAASTVENLEKRYGMFIGLVSDDGIAPAGTGISVFNSAARFHVDMLVTLLVTLIAMVCISDAY